jgi:hypothetical protein
VIALHVLSVLGGIAIVIAVLVSAVETVVMPSTGFTRLTRFVFGITHRLLIRRRYEWRYHQRLLALYAPASLVLLPLVWVISVILGFAFIYWGFHEGSIADSFVISGSSLLTLGFSKPNGKGLTAVTFIEATIGLGIVALLISYLPTIYAGYNTRERGVKRLDPLAGNPPNAEDLLNRLHQFNMLEAQGIWVQVSDWFIDLEQSHTAFPALTYFRSQSPGGSWVSIAGALLESVALVLSSVSDPKNVASVASFAMVMTQGGPALVRIGQASGLPLDDPVSLLELIRASDSDAPAVSVRREEYEQAVKALEDSGVMQPFDHDRGWDRYRRIRSSYDAALRGLAGITGATPAPLTTDRPARVGRPRLIGGSTLRVDWSLGG